MGTLPPLPIATPQRPPARYSNLPLPSYRHVPGLTPHPVKDPRGHLYGQAQPEASSSCRDLPASWAECVEYLYGVDLFNRAYLWEAHETWEMVWIAAGKTSDTAGFVQGLIQVSAALLRSHLGTPRGADNLMTRAGGRFDVIEDQMTGADQDRYLGIAVKSWRRSVEEYLVTSGGTYPFLVLAD